MLRRLLLVMSVAALMAAMMVVMAAPAFAVPPNPVKGAALSEYAQVTAPRSAYPQDPFLPQDPYRGTGGRNVATVAQGVDF